ncbi:hypothetical protein GGR57DRAFT_494985 [Xylariaceae sp. FL1272]|nr:hypothetical protein GGR57DRAFT_494985 [Xylariaceae sp. FL1272]
MSRAALGNRIGNRIGALHGAKCSDATHFKIFYLSRITARYIKAAQLSYRATVAYQDHQQYLLSSRPAQTYDGPTTAPPYIPFPTKPLPPGAGVIQTSCATSSTRGSSWRWELMSLILSSTASSLSPNTVVSILAAIARASLAFTISSCIRQSKCNWFKKRTDSILAFDRFDDASRAPWGAFGCSSGSSSRKPPQSVHLQDQPSTLLAHLTEFRHWVGIGAAVTIFLLSFEPFLQAIISFGGSIGFADGVLEAVLSRSEIIDAGTYNTTGEVLLSGVRLAPWNETIQLKSYRFTYSSGATSNFTASFACSTANCTWSPFTTLAVCRTLNDALIITRGSWTVHLLPYLSLSNLGGEDVTRHDDTLQGPALVSAVGLTDAQNTVSFHHLITMITSLGILSAASGFADGDLIWDDTPVTATECALYFCAQAWANRDYQSYIDAGDNGVTKTTQFGHYNAWNNHSLYSNYGDINRDDLGLFIPQVDLKKLHLSANLTIRFNLTQATIRSTVRYINDEFFSTSIMAWPADSAWLASDTAPVLQALYASSNYSATFETAASSLSKCMRDTSRVPFSGTAQEWVINIQVQWSYVTVPLRAYVLGSGFCLFTMFETRKLGLSPRKTDMIATLTQSVDPETRAQLRYAYKHGFGLRAARTIMTVLEEEDDGFELRVKQS